MEIVADQTNVCRINLLSVRFGEGLSEARQYLKAGNNKAALQAIKEALMLKPDNAEGLAMQATATEQLNTARLQAEVERKRLEQLKRPREVFTALCGQNPDAALFGEHELTSKNPAKNVEIAIIKAVQASRMGFQITYDRMEQAETYQVVAQQTFSLGVLGGTERICLLVVGQTKDDETQILFEVLEYQIQHTAVVNGLNIRDDKQLVPVNGSRLQMNNALLSQLQTGV